MHRTLFIDQKHFHNATVYLIRITNLHAKPIFHFSPRFLYVTQRTHLRQTTNARWWMVYCVIGFKLKKCERRCRGNALAHPSESKLRAKSMIASSGKTLNWRAPVKQAPPSSLPQLDTKVPRHRLRKPTKLTRARTPFNHRHRTTTQPATFVKECTTP